MPEHFVEDIVEFFELLSRMSPDTVKGQKWTALLSFVCQCMQRSSGDALVRRTSVGELSVVGQQASVNNPHLRYGVWRQTSVMPG